MFKGHSNSISRLILGIGICITSGLSAQAQNGQTNLQVQITKAQGTLTEISKLLDSITARQASGGKGSPSTPVPLLAAGSEQNLFDGNTLTGWRHTDFVNAKPVRVERTFRGNQPAIIVEAGDPLNGLTLALPTGTLPRTNYEISLEAMKIQGDDFLCGLTFPVADSYATLVVGGWGGSMVGISSIDGMDASENETSKVITFPKDRWYAIRMRVTPDKLETWLDNKKIIDAKITGKKINLRFGEISKSVPLGLATYQTSAAFRNLKLRRLDGK